MSYGFNNPQGLVPIRSDTNAVLTSSLRTMAIKNGYGTNIFTGDPVIWSGTYAGHPLPAAGYMISLWDYINVQQTTVANENGGGAPILGVFQGVSYSAPNDFTSPNTPMRDYWPAGTNTADGRDPIGYFIPANYEYGFSIQANVNAQPAASMVGSYTRIAFDVTGTTVNGNTQTGQSKCTVDLSALSGVAVTYAASGPNANSNYTTWLIEDLDNSQGTSGSTVPYGNVIIRICNTAYPFFYDRA